MSSNLFQTPILMVVFNRPDTTRKVFEEIRAIKPEKLYIAADGPRSNRAGEEQLCRETRDIFNRIDWPCKITKLFRDTNLGCRKAVGSAISWFFEQEEEGIILEDDCLPHPSFFEYCRQLLQEYRNDSRIMMICGDNFLKNELTSEESYYFSRYCHIWGWASWKRAWQHYDIDLKGFPAFKEQRLIRNIFSDPLERNFWLNIFQNVYDKKIDTWDYQWSYALFTQNGLNIVPAHNLISNIGFGANATHTSGKMKEFAEMPVHEIKISKHPEHVIPNRAADSIIETRLFSGKKNVLKRLRLLFRKIIGRAPLI